MARVSALMHYCQGSSGVCLRISQRRRRCTACRWLRSCSSAGCETAQSRCRCRRCMCAPKPGPATSTAALRASALLRCPPATVQRASPQRARTEHDCESEMVHGLPAPIRVCVCTAREHCLKKRSRGLGCAPCRLAAAARSDTRATAAAGRRAAARRRRSGCSAPRLWRLSSAGCLPTELWGTAS